MNVDGVASELEECASEIGSSPVIAYAFGVLQSHPPQIGGIDATNVARAKTQKPFYALSPSGLEEQERAVCAISLSSGMGVSQNVLNSFTSEGFLLAMRWHLQSVFSPKEFSI
jgi:uncharacterized protein (UPF0210 family)